jgi:hypothetical protein
MSMRNINCTIIARNDNTNKLSFNVTNANLTVESKTAIACVDSFWRTVET